MIDCPNGELRDLLPDYLHGRLDDGRRAEVERHLAGCAACRDELALLRDVQAAVRDVTPAVDVERIAAGIAPYRLPARRGWVTGWRVAAAVVAVAIGGTSLALLRDREPSRVDTAPYVARATTPDGDSDRVAVAAPAVPAPAPQRPAAPSAPAARDSRELAIAGGAISDLSDGELSALVDAIESLDAVPSAEVEGGESLYLGSQEES